MISAVVTQLKDLKEQAEKQAILLQGKMEELIISKKEMQDLNFQTIRYLRAAMC